MEPCFRGRTLSAFVLSKLLGGWLFVGEDPIDHQIKPLAIFLGCVREICLFLNSQPFHPPVGFNIAIIRVCLNAVLYERRKTVMCQSWRGFCGQTLGSILHFWGVADEDLPIFLAHQRQQSGHHPIFRPFDRLFDECALSNRRSVFCRSMDLRISSPSLRLPDRFGHQGVGQDLQDILDVGMNGPLQEKLSVMMDKVTVNRHCAYPRPAVRFFSLCDSIWSTCCPFPPSSL
jgi:hypothetical protein